MFVTAIHPRLKAARYSCGRNNKMYEVEVKSLLGTKEAADRLRARMKALDADVKVLGSHKQLNHYFIGGDLNALFEKIQKFLSVQEKITVEEMQKRIKDYSLRSRLADDKTFLVVKASVDDTTSANGIGRMEFERELSISLDELDKMVLGSGFSYQAKWSRERREYTFKDIYVTIDKNAGYGYLAEFEIQVQKESEITVAKNKIREAMRELGLEELDQTRLERMFAFYNTHWLEYYGTDKVFVVE